MNHAPHCRLRFNTSTIHLTLSPCTILKMTQLLIAMRVRKLVWASPTVATTVISKTDVYCAKLQKEIQLSIHPHHPLTLLQFGNTETESPHFFCDFCNNRCYSEQGHRFCCKQCNFKIDLDCARMLLNFEDIQHVSHEHWLTLIYVERYRRHNFFVEYLEDVIRRQYYCAACREVCYREVCYGDTYCCK